MPASVNPSRKMNVGESERLLSIAGGVLTLYWAVRRASRLRLPALLTAGYLFQRGVTGWCSLYELMDIKRTGDRGQSGVRVVRAMTINQRREEVYNFWRDFTNLPRFMKHLQSVQILEGDGRRSRWVARAPLGMSVEWDAEIIQDTPNELISWRSVEGTRVPNSGSVVFRDAPAGRGTEVHITIQYDPPFGSAGAAAARLFGEEPSQQVLDDLRRFKQMLETGEVASVFGQTSGRASVVAAERAEREHMTLEGKAGKMPAGTFPGNTPDLINRVSDKVSDMLSGDKEA